VEEEEDRRGYKCDLQMDFHRNEAVNPGHSFVFLIPETVILNFGEE